MKSSRAKSLVVTVASVWLAVALGACGGGGGGGGDSATSPTVTTTPSAVATTVATAPVNTATTSAPATAATSGVAVMPVADTTQLACDKTHSRVGQVATLSTRSHGVSGKATVIDNCTLEIRNFSYDGGGLSKVFVYGGKAGNYVAGFPIGVNLRGTVFANQTLTVALNAGDLDRLDGISIWCSDANANFGDGKFAPV